jgi:N-acetylglutamate synthase-like GNAT family acetyltransferase
MMANDTFVKDWILNDEVNKEKIVRYLDAIRNKFGLFVAFLVSDKTGHYYTQNGFVETIKEEKANNAWYYRFKNKQERMRSI